nr:hypothetical protein CFP56_23959 [Quercus suber]
MTYLVAEAPFATEPGAKSCSYGEEMTRWIVMIRRACLVERCCVDTARYGVPPTKKACKGSRKGSRKGSSQDIWKVVIYAHWHGAQFKCCDFGFRLIHVTVSCHGAHNATIKLVRLPTMMVRSVPVGLTTDDPPEVRLLSGGKIHPGCKPLSHERASRAGPVMKQC